MNALTPDVSAGRFSHKGPVMIENARDIFGIDLSPDNAALLDALGIMTPEQSGRLVSDRSHDKAQPDQWTHHTVKRRLIEGAELIERTTGAAGPSRKMTSWIDWQLFRGVTDFERNAMAEGLTERTRAPDRGIYRGAGSREIADAEDAMEWPIRYVADDGERRVLAFWIWCDLHSAPFGRLCPKRRERGNGIPETRQGLVPHRGRSAWR